jgi:hypothetical protein
VNRRKEKTTNASKKTNSLTQTQLLASTNTPYSFQTFPQIGKTMEMKLGEEGERCECKILNKGNPNLSQKDLATIHLCSVQFSNCPVGPLSLRKQHQPSPNHKQTNKQVYKQTNKQEVESMQPISSNNEQIS